MVDSDLNVGQQQYEDRVNNGQVGSSGRESAAANNYYHDYSSDAPDYSASSDSLKDLEQTATSRTTASQSTSRDIGRQERSASMDTKGFDGELNSKSITATKKKRIGKFKKKVVVGGITFFASSGLAMLGFNAISGPMQLLQAFKLIQDFPLGIATGQKTARSFENSRAIAKAIKNGKANSYAEKVQNSRLGKFSLKQANTMIARLESNGVSFNYNALGGRGGISIEPKALGLSSDNLDQDKIAKTLGVDKDKVNIVKDGSGGQKVLLSDKLSYGSAKKIITSLDDTGKWSLRGWLQTRATMKKMGYVSWLHPIKKAEEYAYKKVTDFMAKQIAKLLKPSDSEGLASQAAQKDAADKGKKAGDNQSAKSNVASPDAAGSKAAKALKGAADDLKKVGAKARAVFDKVADFKNKILSIKGVGLATTILTVTCMLKGIWDQAGSYKQTNVVNVAEKGAAQIMGYGSQIESGQDISMNSVGMATKMTMGDNVPVLDSDGNQTDQTVYSSFWDAKAVCTTLGTTGCTQSDDSTPAVLQSVSKGGFQFLPDEANNFVEMVIGNKSIIGLGLSTACDVFSAAGELASNLTPDFIKKNVLGAINNFVMGIITGTKEVAKLISWAMGFLFGVPLDLSSMIPEQWGSVGMFGGKFTSNDQMLGSGGKELTSSEAMELNIENRQYLAWVNNRKSLVARLIDPADYNSSLNQIARSIRIDSSNQNLTTQLANVFKAFTSAPNIIATAGNQLLGSSGYVSAASADYDYGVPTYAWDMTEMNDISSDDDETYDLYQNTSAAINLLETDGNKYRDYADQCLSVTIGDKNDGYKVTLKDNQDGAAWNYVNNSGDTRPAEFCRTMSNKSDSKQIRLYVMDYFNTVSGMCYEGDASDSDAKSACKEMEVESDGSSDSTSIDTAGNQDASNLQDVFKQEAPNGKYGGYSTSSNGCTTITAWFIGQHTTLNYGNGNGSDVVNRLIAANPDKHLLKTTSPTGVPSVFSSSGSNLRSTGSAGHTGVVTAVDADGTIHTLESGANDSMHGLSSPWSKVFSSNKDQYTNGVEFVYLGDYLK